MNIRKNQEERLIGALLRLPYLAVVRQVNESLIAAGYEDLRPAHLAVFQHIDTENGSNLTWLAEQEDITKPSMMFLVDYLEAQGYVERMPDPSDGRAKLVCLTKRGAKVMATAQQIMRGIEAEWADYVGEQEMNHLHKTLKKLVARLEM